MVNALGVLFGGVFLLVGVGMVGVGVLRFRKWFTMRSMDPSGAMTVSEGLQEIEGTAHAVDGTVTAPFTGTDSLVCKYKVERYRYDDDGSNWHTEAQETKAVPFELHHDGSTVAVQPDEAQKLLTDEFKVDTGKTGDIPPRVQNYLGDNDASIELGPIEIGGNRRYRFTEERLDEGEEVYVLGPAEKGPSAVPGESDARVGIDPGDRGWKDKVFGNPFVLSDSGEGEAEWRQLKSALAMFAFGLVFSAPGVFVVYLAATGGF